MGYLATIINKIGQMFTMGVGIHLVFSLGGIFFLGFPTVVSVAAYTLAICEKQGMSPWLALIAALIAGLIVSLLFAYLFIKVSADSFAVLGLASVIAFNALALSLDTLTNGVLGISGIKRPELFDSLPALAIAAILVALLMIIFEILLLKTTFGRALRALKENKTSLAALGVSPNKISTIIIVITGIIFSIAGIFMIWQVQFLDPGFGGLHLLVEVLTIGILALRPQIRWVALGTLFVVFVPEALRFLSLPSTILGHLRILLYCTFLIVLILKLQDKLHIPHRSI